MVKQIVRNLNRVIDINYPFNFRKGQIAVIDPTGLGVQGLADVFAVEMGFDTEEVNL